MQKNDIVLSERRATTSGHQIGIATLNAVKSLNALNLDMVRRLQQLLDDWEDDPAVAAVVLRGAGDKAFCAGGDVRSLREALLRDATWPNPDARTFFSEEYRLDFHIHRFTKPLVVWGGGIVMGGGMGLMVGASHRIATLSTRMAMPEIAIGLYPDVGGTWFLQRMPSGVGAFLGLTGAPLNAHDALVCNLADHVLDDDAQATMIDALCEIDWNAAPAFHRDEVTRAIGRLDAARHTPLPESAVVRNLPAIHALMSLGGLKDVTQGLSDGAADGSFTDPWLAAAAKSFSHGSPTSAAVTWEALRRTRHLSLAQALRQELVMSVNFCARPDFSEGVRALLVDKDRNPRWRYRKLDDMPDGWIEGHFESPWTPADHPLADLDRGDANRVQPR